MKTGRLRLSQGILIERQRELPDVPWARFMLWHSVSLIQYNSSRSFAVIPPSRFHSSTVWPKGVPSYLDHHFARALQLSWSSVMQAISDEWAQSVRASKHYDPRAKAVRVLRSLYLAWTLRGPVSEESTSKSPVPLCRAVLPSVLPPADAQRSCTPNPARRSWLELVQSL